MKLVEFQIAMPLSLEEYRRGQLYMVARMTKEQLNASEKTGAEVIKNEPCQLPQHGKGIYTKKLYHYRNRLPSYVRAVTPKKASFIVEESWNCFPYSRTVLAHPSFSKFSVEIETIHMEAQRGPDGDLKYEENVHQLGPEALKKRTVKRIDIADNSDMDSKKLDPSTDPSVFCSRAGRGPLKEGWSKRENPCMIAYKKVTIHCSYFGIQTIVQNYLEGYEHGLFKDSHRRLWCWQDEWIHMSTEELLIFEQKVSQEMNEGMRQIMAGGSTQLEEEQKDVSLVSFEDEDEEALKK